MNSQTPKGFFSYKDFEDLDFCDIGEPGMTSECPDYYYNSEKLAEVVNRVLKEKVMKLLEGEKE